jgi:hypothetical protein
MNVEQEVWRLAGLIEGHDKEIGGMRGQLSTIEATGGRIEERMGSIEEKLDRVIGSGLHPTVAHPPQAATEPIVKAKATDRMVALLNSKGGLHAFYLLLIAILAGMGLATYSGKSVYELIGVQGGAARSGITLPPEDDRNPKTAPREQRATP